MDAASTGNRNTRTAKNVVLVILLMVLAVLGLLVLLIGTATSMKGIPYLDIADSRISENTGAISYYDSIKDNESYVSFYRSVKSALENGRTVNGKSSRLRDDEGSIEIYYNGDSGKEIEASNIHSIPFKDTEKGLSPKEMNYIISLVLLDNPLLTICSDWNSFLYNDGGYILLSGSKNDTIAEYGGKKEEADTIATEMARQVVEVSNGSEYLFLKNAYIELAANFETAENPSVFTGAGEEHRNDVWGALAEKNAYCLGRSAAMKIIMDETGLENFIAMGEVGGTKHVLNVVKIEGNWYFMDLMAAKPGALKTEIAKMIPGFDMVIYSNFLIAAENIERFDGGIYTIYDESKELLRR